MSSKHGYNPVILLSKERNNMIKEAALCIVP